MFLDESGDHSLSKIDPSYPMFVLAGCIFDMEYYVEEVEPAVAKLKAKHFGSDEVILRSYDIRKQKKEFKSLVDKKKRDAFYTDLNGLIAETDFKVIAAAINKAVLSEKHTKPGNPYDLCLEFILERAVMYLGRSKEQMLLRIESREGHNDQTLAEQFERFRRGEGGKFPALEVQRKLIDLSFNQKSQNIAGMQLADLVAYPIGKYVLDHEKENQAFTIIEPKFHSRSGVYLGSGLKVYP